MRAGAAAEQSPGDLLDGQCAAPRLDDGGGASGGRRPVAGAALVHGPHSHVVADVVVQVFDFHGWVGGGQGLFVGPLRGRRQLVLDAVANDLRSGSGDGGGRAPGGGELSVAGDEQQFRWWSRRVGHPGSAVHPDPQLDLASFRPGQIGVRPLHMDMVGAGARQWEGSGAHAELIGPQRLVHSLVELDPQPARPAWVVPVVFADRPEIVGDASHLKTADAQPGGTIRRARETAPHPGADRNHTQHPRPHRR